MKVSLFTPIPAFANDMADVIRVFFGNIELLLNLPGGEMTVTHTEWMAEDSQRVCLVEVSGQKQAACRKTAPMQSDALLEKRLHKRQIKQCVSR